MLDEPKIILAKNSGFCFGVKRALNIAIKANSEYPNLITIGPLIHNPQMVKQLESRGIKSVSSLENIKNFPVIIRSHGIEKKLLIELKKSKNRIINATCPFVAKAQTNAQNLCNEGYPIIIFGDKNHPEVIAIKSYISNEVIVVSNKKQLEGKKFKKVALISQTTQNVDNLKEIASSLVEISDEIKIVNTICSATSVRQNSTEEMAKISDLVIVIGGKNSSNTKQLALISKKHTKTYHIETEKEIDNDWFKGCKIIGITAGASTPDWIILNVYNKIKNSIGNVIQETLKIEDIPGFEEEQNERTN